MSPTSFIIMLVAAIVILTVLTLKFKMHPVMTLFITAVFIGLVSGKPLVDTFNSIKNYFGSTLGSIGVMIIFGAVIASGISDTGAATSIVNFFIRLFKGKRLELAPALTGFIMSIPVFGDIAIILNAPISAILAKRKNMSMSQVAPFVNLGLTLTHGLVPPTPGVLAVAVLLQADIGTVIMWGLVCSVVSFAVCYFALAPIYAKGEFIEPLADYTEGIEAVDDGASVEKLLIAEENAPGAGMSFVPLLLPAVMIAVGSIGKLMVEEGSGAYVFFNTFGDTVLALFCGIVALGLMVFGRKDKVVKKANEDRKCHCQNEFPQPADSLPAGCHFDDGLRFHDDCIHDGGGSDGGAGSGSGHEPGCGHSGYRRRFHGWLARKQQRILDLYLPLRL